MADGDGLVQRPQGDQNSYHGDLVSRWTQSGQDGEIWPGSGIFPTWNTDGVLGGIRELAPVYNSLNMLMTPEEQKTIAPLDGSAGGIDGISGVQLPSWPGNGGAAPAMSLDQTDPDQLHPVLARPAGNYFGDDLPFGPSTPVGQTPGFPESGKNSWRTELDDQITIGANKFNADHGYQPGDPLYMTPQTLKSWIMEESGSGATRNAFETDPLQANNPGDWDHAKAGVGLSQGQQMTPMSSINGGLGWFQYKADQLAKANPDVTMSDVLKAYNGNSKIDPNGLPHSQNYANAILSRVGNGN